MPENPYFYRFLNGLEFLRFYANIAGIPAEDAKKKAERLLSVVGLEHAAKVRISDYSKGMVTRVGLAQALITDPALILLDEPMSGLDPIGRREIRDLILELKEQKKTIFFCSHILADVEMLCDRIAILNKGKLIKEGTVADFLATGATTYTVSLSNLPEGSENTLLPLAEKHEEIGGLVHLTAKDQETAQQIANAATQANARVIELRPDRGNLEDYFVREVGAK